MTDNIKTEADKQLDKLLKSGFKSLDMFKKDRTPTEILSDQMEYQEFYTISSELIKQIMPSRYEEFCLMYRNTKRKSIDVENYTILDYINGLTVTRYGEKVFEPSNVASQKLLHQIAILRAIRSSIGSLLIDLKTVVSADLYESEISACRGLHKAKHLRAAGALAGVILEKHLGVVASSKSININKRNPSIADYIEGLKLAGTIDLVQWRGLQRLADIRNLATHNKDREPTADEVLELIDGVDKALKTIN